MLNSIAELTTTYLNFKRDLSLSCLGAIVVLKLKMTNLRGIEWALLIFNPEMMF